MDYTFSREHLARSNVSDFHFLRTLFFSFGLEISHLARTKWTYHPTFTHNFKLLPFLCLLSILKFTPNCYVNREDKLWAYACFNCRHTWLPSCSKIQSALYFLQFLLRKLLDCKTAGIVMLFSVIISVLADHFKCKASCSDRPL